VISDLSALDSQNVKLTENQTISGVKTFSNDIQIFNDTIRQTLKIGKSNTRDDYGEINYHFPNYDTRWFFIGFMNSNGITIHNTKTNFSKPIICSSTIVGTNVLEDNETRLSKVISDLSSSDSQNVKLVGAQSIYGTKTFNDNIVVNTINGLTLKNSVKGSFINCVPIIKNDGVMEVGKYIDMHENNSSSDNDARFSLNNKTVSLNTNFIATNLKSDNETRLSKVISDLSSSDSQNVKISGDQTISGIKTFTNNIVSNSTIVGTNVLADNEIRLNNLTSDVNNIKEDYVNLRNSQTISGIKTFISPLRIDINAPGTSLTIKKILLVSI
jgi:hypothetical protein